MSEARKKLIKFCLEKYPSTSLAHAEKIADEFLKEALKPEPKEESEVKSRIKKQAGIK